MGGVREFYANKNVLLTGTTGFVGKVVLEKLLRTVPDIGTIYVLIRNKEGSSPMERFKKSVLGTACFDKLKKIHPKFDDFINHKVVTIGGDLDKEGLNISQMELEMLIEKVHVVLNVAGSVDFDAPLGTSINTNVQGAMRLLDLCKRIKNLQSFVHVSTCYVNSDKKGIVEEKIYLTSENPDIVLNEILNVPSGQLESRTRALIGEFPNTYTFAKALGERMLQKHRENIPLTIATKQNVLRTLGTETNRPSIAAQCVVAIAGIELPFGQWVEVIDILKANVTTEGNIEKLKDSSLEALGYICQDVTAAAIESKSNEILTAIVGGMRDQHSTLVKLSATEAMLNALELAKNNFENLNERNFIMQTVCEGTQAPDSRIRVAALQCLVRIVSLYYNHMDNYMKEALFPITLKAMQSDDNNFVLQGIEFWSNICEEELVLACQEEEAREENRAPAVVSRYYAKGALQHILPHLLNTLAKQEEHDDEDEWVPAKAAGVCIMLLAQCTKDEIVPLIIPFVQQHFSNPDWHFREAAIMAFGSILDGPSPDLLNQLVGNAITALIRTLSDPHMVVRDTSAWALGRVCDTCENLVTREEVLRDLVPALFTALEQEPRVAFNACWALSSLVKAAYQIAKDQGTDAAGEPESYVLSPVFQEMVTRLVRVTDRPDAGENNLRISGYEALMELIKNSPKDCYPHIRSTTQDVLQRLQHVLSIDDKTLSTTDRSQLRDLQSLLCATLQSVLRKMRRDDAVAIADLVMAALVHIMQRCANQEAGGVMEDALMAISTLIEVLGVNFAKYMEEFKPYLFNALRSHEEHQICQAAIGVVSDLCHAFEDKIAPLMDDMVQLLLQILQDSNVKHAVKPHALGCFGDIAIALGPNYNRYLVHTMDFLMNAVNAAQITNPDDLEQVEYVESLRENCISGFTGIVQAMRSSDEGLRQLHPVVPQMVRLISMVAESGTLSSDELQGSTCGLIGDLIDVLGRDILQLLDTPAINNLLQRCRRSKVQKAKSLGVWASRELSHLRRQVAVN